MKHVGISFLIVLFNFFLGILPGLVLHNTDEIYVPFVFIILLIAIVGSIGTMPVYKGRARLGWIEVYITFGVYFRSFSNRDI